MANTKKMKLIIAMTTGLLLSLGTFAQGRESKHAHLTPEQRAEKKTAMMAERLKLDQSQRAEVYKINLDAARKMQPHVEAIQKEHKEMRPIAKERNERLRAVLTDEQKAQLKTDAVRRKRGNGERMMRTVPAERMAPAETR